MDPSIGWFQPEQEGPSKVLWTRIWEAQKGLDSMNIIDTNPNVGSKAPEFIPVESLTNNDDPDRVTNNNTCYKRRRKRKNRASTYGMDFNQASLVGEHGGCPWRNPNKIYGRGVIGCVIYI